MSFLNISCFIYLVTSGEGAAYPSEAPVSSGMKHIIHQSELRIYTKVVPFKENSSFRFVVLWQILNGME
jgi:hypothetical protein